MDIARAAQISWKSTVRTPATSVMVSESVTSYLLSLGGLSSDACQPEVDFLHSWAVISVNFFCQIVSIRVKTFSNTNLQALRNMLRENGSLPVYVRRSKKSLLNLPIIHSKVFWFLIVLLPAYLLFHNNAQNWMFSWHHPIKEKNPGWMTWIFQQQIIA